MLFDMPKPHFFFGLFIFYAASLAVPVMGTCPPGSTGSESGPCVQCAAGKYSSESGTTVCTDCPSNAGSPEGSTDCVCGPGAVQSTSPVISCSGDCPCPAAPAPYNGQIRSNSASEYVNNANCIWTIVADAPISLSFSAFATGYRSDFVTIWTCTSGSCAQSTQILKRSGNYQPTHSYIAIGVTSTVFRIQFNSDSSGVWTGFVLNWNTMDGCMLCVAGKYKIDRVPAESSVCEWCVANSQSLAGSSSCICNAGAQRDDEGLCALCVAGKYKSNVGSAECTDCPANTISPEGSSQELDCACNAGSYISTTMSCSGSCPCPSASGLRSGQILSQTWILYANYLNCKWIISAENAISVQFSRFSVELNSDFVYIDSCTSSSCNAFTNLAKLTGYNIPSTYVSPTGYLRIRFKTSPMRALYGFAIQWNVVSSVTDSPCTLCAAGKYKIDPSNAVCTNCMSNQYSVDVGAIANTCQDCPANSVSPSASNEQLDCACNAGSTRSDEGGLCVQCAAGKYKVQIGNGACVHCDAGKYSSHVGAQVESSNCQRCGPGKSTRGLDARTDDTECVECIPGKYAMNYGNAECTLCSPGKYVTQAGTESCTNCQENTYSPVWGAGAASVCVSCPANSVSPAGSNEQSDCKCNAGWTGSTGSCVQCGAGKYKNVIDNAVCSSCAAGQYSTAIAATSNTCLFCPSSSSSPIASPYPQDCTCNAGWTGANGGTCTQCAAGTYKIVTGDAQCTNCVAGQYSMALGAIFDVCQTCASNSNAPEASDTQTDCTCNSGYTGGDGGSCSACVAGKYKIDTGDAVCTNCVAGTYSVISASISETNCLACEAGTSTLGQDARSQQSDCIECSTGTYTAKQNANAVCTLCALDTFSATLAAISISTCIPCNSTQVSVAGSNKCTTCLNGQYKPTDSVTCANCEFGHFCRGGQAILCDENSQTVPYDRTDAGAAQDCRCNPGYSHRASDDYDTDTIVSDNVCYACTPGYYNPDLGITECSPCGPGYFSPMFASLSIENCEPCEADTFSMVGEKECTACTANSQAPRISGMQENCVCNVGYTGLDGATCTACDAGKYKLAVGSAACNSCVAGQYSTVIAATSNTCLSCLVNSNSPLASSKQQDCNCNAGWTGPNGGVCIECVAGKYKIANGNEPCVNCLAGHYSTVVGGVDSDICQSCPPSSDSAEGSVQQSDCTCIAGHSGADGGVCTQCIAGKHKSESGSATCTNCLAAKYSTAVGATSDVCQNCPSNSDCAEASDEKSDCACNIGFAGANGETCDQCDAGKYKKTIGDACQNCRIDSSSPAQSGFCTCDAGLAEAHDDTCIPCAVGKYRPGSFITNWARSCGADMQQACTAKQRSTGWGGSASRAVDGNSNAGFWSSSCTHTGGGKNWWSVDFGERPIRITGLRLRGRSDEAWGRTQGYEIYIGNDTSSTGRFANNQVCVENQDHLSRRKADEISCAQPITGRIVIFYVPRSTSYSLCEVSVWSSDCSSCPLNSNSALASDALVDCKCNPGSTGQDGESCVLCPTGTFKSESGSGSCNLCAAGTYNDNVGSSFCAVCTDNSNSPGGSVSVASCTCNPGSTEADEGTICALCAVDTYKTSAGPNSCTSCETGVYR